MANSCASKICLFVSPRLPSSAVQQLDCASIVCSLRDEETRALDGASSIALLLYQV